MTDAERLALEMWAERAQGRASLEKASRPMDKGLDVTSVLGRLRVIPNHLDVAIRKARGEYENAMRYGPESRRIRALAQWERALKAAGLE